MRDLHEGPVRRAPRSRWSLLGAVLLVSAVLPVVVFSTALPALGGAAAMVAAGVVLLSGRARVRRPDGDGRPGPLLQGRPRPVPGDAAAVLHGVG